MPFYTDQLNRKIEIVAVPQRIVSLVPSQTELLYDLGLRETVAGITKFCVHPQEWFRNKTRVGGTKTVHVEKIKALKPDLILANKEENLREQIETLASDFPVWVSDVNNLEDAYGMMESVGVITGRKIESRAIISKIKDRFSKLQTQGKTVRTAYLIWNEPYMTIGGDTFINAVLEEGGFANIFKKEKRYPVITVKDLQAADCELLFLSSEPYPFKQKHVERLQNDLPETKILSVDGELFSWYGSRLLHTPSYLQMLRKQIAAAT